MPEVTKHEPGTPSWVDLGTPDVDGAASFYAALFGWEVEAVGPEDETGGYRMCRLGGRSVAGLGPQQGEGLPYWTTYVTVDDVEATTAKVAPAGGTVIVPPMDVMDLGRMAVLADPGGATFSIWQPIAHIGAEVVGDNGAMVWNELTTRNVPGATAFYGAVFGWTFAESAFGGPYQEIGCAGRTVGGLMPMEGEEWGDLPDHWMVYFAVDDPDAVAAKAIELGGAAPVPPQDIPPGRFAVLNDAQGAHFSILRPTPPPS